MAFIQLNYTVKNYAKQINKDDFSSYVLGVDIGGTNTNLGVAGIKNNRPALLLSINFKSREINSFTLLVKETLEYTKKQHGIKINHACIGAAGIVSVNQNFADLTNIEWDVNTDKLLQETALQSAFIINDFQAIGYGINLLNQNNTNDIFKVRDVANLNDPSKATKAILGAGTGLGKSILIYDEQLNVYIPISSEGGHSDFPAQNDFEFKLLEFIKNLSNFSEPVCYEELLSGRGIESIYLYLKQSSSKETGYSKEIEEAADKAALISKYRPVDDTCKEAFQLFARFYGRCAKNFVLDTMATGGLYIAGGIASKNKDIFLSNEFLDEFENAYQRDDVLKQTPIYVIMNYDVSLYGACFAAMYKNLEEII